MGWYGKNDGSDDGEFYRRKKKEAEERSRTSSHLNKDDDSELDTKPDDDVRLKNKWTDG